MPSQRLGPRPIDEGVRIIGNILGSAPDDIAIGRRVELVWDKLDDGTPYPAWCERHLSQ
jgi:uncharacterized OB-fold protein